MTVCIECNGVCELVDSAVIYPRRHDLHGKPRWKCTKCAGSHCGCHPGGTEPLGFAAGRTTRRARMLLHNDRLDPIWKNASKSQKRGARTRVYTYLSAQMNLPPEETHTGMWTVEQCREAWRALEGQTAQSIADWLDDQENSEGQAV